MLTKDVRLGDAKDRSRIKKMRSGRKERSLEIWRLDFRARRTRVV
jgi:hypothetical protein